MKEKVESNTDKINELLTELNECRKDNRHSENEIIQILSVAATILGVIFSASFLVADKQPEDSVSISLFFLSGTIFITTFLYIITLGIGNVIRYHYMQEIEDTLSKINGHNSFIHWVSLEASITTRNPKHLKNGYSIIHYFCYTGATIFAILFSILIIIVLYNKAIKYNHSLVALGKYIMIIFTSLA